MKELIKFEFKKFFKKKKNVISLIILCLIIIAYILINISLENSKISSKTYIYNDELESFKDSHMRLTQEYNTNKLSQLKILIEKTSEQINIINVRNEALMKEDWKTELNMQIKLDEQLLDDITNNKVISGVNPKELKDRIDKSKILYKKNIKPIIEENSMTSYNFIRLVIKDIFPVLFIIIILLLSADVVSSENDEGTFKFLLIQPISRSKILISKMISISLISLLSIILILFIFFIALGVTKGFGSPIYPVAYYTNGVFKFIDIRQFILYLIPLMGLVIISISSMGILISTIVNNATASICTSIIILVGANTLNNKLNLIKDISHIFPFTYNDITNILNGKLSSYLDNSNINYVTGAIVLIVFIIICCTVSIRVFKKKDIIC